MVHSAAARLVAATGAGQTCESNIFGVSRAREPLAEIKLNPISVEQFLAAASSLADNNAGVQADLADAIERARSSAQLIDHLRALFSHQQAVEFVRGGGDGGEDEDDDYVGRDSDLAELYLSAGAPESGSSLQRTLLSGARTDTGPACDAQHERRQHTQNLALFSYSNQRTLIKAAKLLIASVAKILYLADSIVLQSGAGADWPAPAAEGARNEQQWRADRQKEDIRHQTQAQRTDLISNRRVPAQPLAYYPFELTASLPPAPADTIRTAGGKFAAAASLGAAALAAEQVSSLALLLLVLLLLLLLFAFVC